MVDSESRAGQSRARSSSRAAGWRVRAGEVTEEVAGRSHGAESTVWQVTTGGSEYTLDPAGGRVRRTPVAAPGLRRDGTWVRLLGVLDLRVGHPMVLVLLLRDDGISTIRYSSRVLRVRRLTSPPGTP